ncbi:MarR family winged helix-turn-helix transcriptional regulator [Vallitalea okinawensis]|uniref:MarR family winged helix-turn-helix transcriptional regulator n=1 Tax=Vallitalea okinawensis TaxID=2078660 RepID=UPI000CFC09B8|nr:MarR family transcriptional regulator [Vallitalea okinawensis]
MEEALFNDLFLNMVQLMPLFRKKLGPAYDRVDRVDKILKKNQIGTVMMVGHNGQMTSTMLGKCLDMKKGSLTTLIDSLEEKGFVYRERDKKDRRKTWIRLTEQGQNYRQEKYRLLKQEYAEILSNLSDKEVQELHESIVKVVNIVDKL